MSYELYYWPGIQGRGEFVRLALEEGGVDYVDYALVPEEDGGGAAAVMRMLGDAALGRPPFAPPILRHGDALLSQTPNILLYLGVRLGLAPDDEAGRLWVNQLQLTIADFVDEIHDTHHPLGSGLYYEDQQPEAGRRSSDFLDNRLPKFLGYFESVLARNTAAGGWLAGKLPTYADLSLAQAVAGLEYAFPKRMGAVAGEYPGVMALSESVWARPRIASYVESGRRLAFNDHGLFRHYPELDV